MGKVRIAFDEGYTEEILSGSISDEVIVSKVKEMLSGKLKLFKYNKLKRKEIGLSKKKRSSNREKELSQVAEEFKSDLIKKQTPAEKTFKALLKSLKIEYEFQKIFYTPTKFYIVDFYVPEYRIVFEIDGGYHDEKEQKKQDRARTKILKETKSVYEVYRFNNVDVLENMKFVTDRINQICVYKK